MTTTVPTLPQFVRDRVQDFADAYGWDFAPIGEALIDGRVFTAADIADHRGYFVLGVDDAGALWDLSTYSPAQRVTLHGFTWHAEPTDTGAVHGPVARLHADRTALRRRVKGGASRLYVAAMALGIGPVPAGTTFGTRDAHDGLRVDTGREHGPVTAPTTFPVGRPPATCPRCGSDDLGYCGATPARTDHDITDVVECNACKHEMTVDGYARIPGTTRTV